MIPNTSINVNNTIILSVIPIKLNTMNEIINDNGIDVATSNEFFNPIKKNNIRHTSTTPVIIPFSSS